MLSVFIRVNPWLKFFLHPHLTQIPEVLLQHQRNRSPQPGHSIFVGGSEAGNGASGQHLRGHFTFDDRSETMPAASQVADHHNALRRYACHHHAQSAAGIASHFFQGRHRLLIVLLGAVEQILECHVPRLGRRLQIVAEARAIRREHLPAAVPAAPAGRSVGVDRHVAELARHIVQTAH